MDITLVGDIHNRSNYANSDFLPPNSIQVGDFHDISYDEWEKNNSTRPHGWQDEKRFFIEGNHDFYPSLKLDHTEPYEVAKGLYHIPRGYISGEVLFIGGAFSYVKVKDMPWFPEYEQLSQKQFERIMRKLTYTYIDTIVTHDLPSFIHPHLGLYDMPAPHNFYLWEIYNAAKPIKWIAGHHHKVRDIKVGNCQFTILGIAQQRTFDLNIGPEICSE